MMVFILILINLGFTHPAVSFGVRNLASTSSRRNHLTEATVPHGRFKRLLQCEFNEWQCRDGSCIAAKRKCDGKIDCSDETDEIHAMCRSSNGKFRCLDDNEISVVDLCDGIANCPDGSDETISACAFQICTSHQFQCEYGACVDKGSGCNGRKDCVDGSDEADELCPKILPTTTSVPQLWPEEDYPFVHYLSDLSLSNDTFRCKDGYVISDVHFCDGLKHCPDGSDETSSACGGHSCASHLFQCAYGACAEKCSDCNGRRDWLVRPDELDELCPKILPTTTSVPSEDNPFASELSDLSLSNDTFRCIDGYEISDVHLCNGIQHCPDGSDETSRACEGHSCASHLFQCAYGACVDKGSDCNGHKDCADGSDEAAELCHEKHNLQPTAIKEPVLSAPCVLPPYPGHGRYVVAHDPFATPGQSLQSVLLNITCEQGYDVVGDPVVFCQDGIWSVETIPKCVRFCKLEQHDSVNYKCLFKPSRDDYSRICNDHEPEGTRVSPECKYNYFSDDIQPLMKCNMDGIWNYIAKCKPDCGLVTPSSVTLIGGDDARPAMRGELPWHAVVYRKRFNNNTYTLICGGSLVTRSLVISAAHCFWDKARNKLAAASSYVVAVAKLFSAWDHKDDVDAQKSEISFIKIPELYSDALANYQEDIALVILKSPFDYHNYVRPVCLNFGREFNDQQLQEGNSGKVAGFGLIDEDGNTTDILRVVDLPFVSKTRCKEITPLSFRENITGDKICAGFNNGSAALCRGDSGGGLSFPSNERGTTRFYLRGVASTAPKNDQKCNLFTVITFTQIRKHQEFIEEYL